MGTSSAYQCTCACVCTQRSRLPVMPIYYCLTKEYIHMPLLCYFGATALACHVKRQQAAPAEEKGA